MLSTNQSTSWLLVILLFNYLYVDNYNLWEYILPRSLSSSALKRLTSLPYTPICHSMLKNRLKAISWIVCRKTKWPTSIYVSCFRTNLILHETTLKGSVTTYFLYLVYVFSREFDISIGTNCTPLSPTCSLIRMKQTANKGISWKAKEDSTFA